MQAVKIEPNLRGQLAGTSFLNNQAAAPPSPSLINSRPASNARGAPGSPPQPQPQPLPHGYSDASAPAVPSAISTPDSEAHIHPSLRSSPTYLATTSMMSSGIPPASDHGGPAAGPSSSSASTAAHDMDLDDIGDNAADGRTAKRELSQSKRAAQNRAAQRAFRQRKEGYIKKLEQQVRDYSDMENNYKAMQSENYALREYVIQLQSRLLGAQGEYPQPPPNINLSHPGLPHPAQAPAPIQPAARAPEPAPNSAGPAAGTPLEAVAQAVANLERAEHPYSAKQANNDEGRTQDEISRQLHGDGIPAASM